MTDPRPPLPASRSLRPALALLAGLGIVAVFWLCVLSLSLGLIAA